MPGLESAHGALFLAATAGSALTLLAVGAVTLVVLGYWMTRLRRANRRLESELDSLQRRLDSEQRHGISPAAQLEAEWTKLRARHNRHGERFSLVVFDVGDALRPSTTLRPVVAETVSAALDSVRRAEDSLYRLDERTFAALLASCEMGGARAFVDRVRSRLGNEPIKDESGTTYVGITAGVAEWDERMGSIAALIRAACADRDLFRQNLQREVTQQFAPGV